MDFQRADLGLFKSLLDRVPWEAALKGKGVQEGWTFFREEVLKAQQQAVPVHGKVSRPGKRPAWLNKEVRSQLGEKRRLYGLWKKGQATQEDYKGGVKLCKEKIRKAKAQLDLDLALDVKNNKKNFYQYINSKRRTRESLHPLLDVGGNVVTTDEEKAEVLNAFFGSVFSSGVGRPPSTQTPELAVRGGEQNGAPIIQREVVRDLLQNLDTNKSMGPDGIPLRVLRELGEVLVEPLSIIYQQSWQTGKVPANWRLANVMPIHKKGRKDDPGNSRPVSLTSVPGKAMEQIILCAIMWCMKDTQVIGPSQHGLMRGRSCLTNLIYDKVTRLDERKAVDVVYLDFSKAFDTVSHSILLEKLAAHGLDGRTLHWVKNWLEGQAQRVVLSGIQESFWDDSSWNRSSRDYASREQNCKKTSEDNRVSGTQQETLGVPTATRTVAESAGVAQRTIRAQQPTEPVCPSGDNAGMLLGKTVGYPASPRDSGKAQ
ncbi:rna-directed dna polymerase from mobile element jockey-like [Limosa lapponica baueri]|uniref:Rna-directed dna polymerase from mobile element jockey-like n=1 Tax=Limosa lapponica baueri TaxID=1758121 RepID=A0A2I0U4S1_LIMLA|nr:rna-directed dna polymerase from mobile element jockey-like [Limosa lapponica baueri]